MTKKDRRQGRPDARTEDEVVERRKGDRRGGTRVAVSLWVEEKKGEDLYFPEMDSPILNNGMAENLDWERYARGLVTLRYRDFTFQASMAQRSKGIPTGAYGTTFNHPDAESRDGHWFAEGRFSRSLGPSAELTARGYADSDWKLFHCQSVGSSVLCVLSQNGIFPVRLHMHSHACPDFSAVNTCGVNDVTLCEPSQNG